jgi:hypothetical protein
MLTLIVTAKAVIEIALFALVGQALLGLLVGEKRANNAFYQVLRSVAQPVPWLLDRLIGRWVPGRHHGWMAGLLLVLAWLWVLRLKVGWCLRIGIEACR